MNATHATGGPTSATLLRLAATGGRSDRLRIALTAVGSAVAAMLLLTAASVAFISTGDGPYKLNVLDEPGLRPGVMIAILLLTVPLVVFTGLCTRVGAPARDRRLSIFRMAGATPSETTRIAALETSLAAFAGAVVGTAVFLLGRGSVNSTSAGWSTVSDSNANATSEQAMVKALPFDVDIPIPAMIAIVAAITLGATAASVLAMRKVRVSPFGVHRTTPSAPPTKTAATLFFGGAVGLVVLGATTRSVEGALLPITIGAFVLFVACAVGLLTGSASIASSVGHLLAPRVSRPDLLIASRRMIAAPYTASRATASVLLAVLIGGAVQGTRANFLAGADPSDTFYADTFTLLDGVLVIAVVLAAASLVITSGEAIVERRRTLAVLAASGTPRSVLGRAAVMESLVPLIPSVVLASGAGLFASRAFFGTTVSRLESFAVDGSSETIVVAVPIPWERIAVLCGGAIAVSVAINALSLLFLVRSTRPAELRAAA